MDMCFGFLANTIYFRSWAISFARSLTSPPASPPILPEKRARLRNVYLNVFPRLLEKKCLTCKCLTRQRCSSWRRFLTQVEISDFEFECHIKGLFPNSPSVSNICWWIGILPTYVETIFKLKEHCPPLSFVRQRAKSRATRESATKVKERRRREKEKEEGSWATGRAPTTASRK